MENVFKNTAASVILSITLIIMVLLLKPLINQFIKANIVTECINVSRVDTTYQDGTRLDGPNKDWYDICIKEINK